MMLSTNLISVETFQCLTLNDTGYLRTLSKKACKQDQADSTKAMVAS